MKNVILLYQISFILGLNIGEISRLKFVNYDKKRATLKFLRDNKIITRTLLLKVSIFYTFNFS